MQKKMGNNQKRMKFSAMYPKTGKKSEQFMSNLLKHAQAKSSS
jgi:hypothetical protein